MTESVATTPIQPQPSTANGNSNGASQKPVDKDNPRVAAILAAAAKCFARKGFDGTTLADIGQELGLRKSIVHYYFASKEALIHEVQAYSYRKYLEQVRGALQTADDTSGERTDAALQALWAAVQSEKTLAGLNIELWSAARRDDEVRKGAASLQAESREIINAGIRDVMGPEAERVPHPEALATLIMAVLNGLTVAEYLEGDERAETEKAFKTFLHLMKLGLKSLPHDAE